MAFDLNDELDDLIVDARLAGLSDNEIISGFELKLMALREEQADG